MFYDGASNTFGENCIEHTESSATVGEKYIYDPLALSAKRSTGDNRVTSQSLRQE